MTALRTAAQQALEAWDTRAGIDTASRAFEALRTALAQQEEPVEPVAWRFKAMIGLPWSLSDDGYYISCKRDQRYFVEALYTAPPQRKPLTDDEIFAIENDIPDDVVSDRHWTIWYARAVERAHGIGEQA